MTLQEYINVLQRFIEENPEARNLQVWGYNHLGFVALEPKPELRNLAILGRREYKNRVWFDWNGEEKKGEAIIRI